MWTLIILEAATACAIPPAYFLIEVLRGNMRNPHDA